MWVTSENSHLRGRPGIRSECACASHLQSDVTPAQLEELEAAECWTQQQAMLAELDEQQEQLQMVS